MRNDEIAALTYWQLKAFTSDGAEYLTEVYDSPEEAQHHFCRVMNQIGVRKGSLTYFDGDYCKTLAAFNMDGFEGWEG